MLKLFAIFFAFGKVGGISIIDAKKFWKAAQKFTVLAASLFLKLASFCQKRRKFYRFSLKATTFDGAARFRR